MNKMENSYVICWFFDCFVCFVCLFVSTFSFLVVFFSRILSLFEFDHDNKKIRNFNQNQKREREWMKSNQIKSNHDLYVFQHQQHLSVCVCVCKNNLIRPLYFHFLIQFQCLPISFYGFKCDIYITKQQNKIFFLLILMFVYKRRKVCVCVYHIHTNKAS